MNSFLPFAYRVRAVDRAGVVQHEQTFAAHPGFDPQLAADRYAHRAEKLFPECNVTVVALTEEDVKK